MLCRACLLLVLLLSVGAPMMTSTASAADLTRISLARSQGPVGMTGPGSPLVFDEEVNESMRTRLVIPANDSFYVIRQVHLEDVRAGEEFSVTAEAELSNELITRDSQGGNVRHDVRYHTTVVYSTSPAGAAGTEITEAGGEYILPDVHHWMSQHSGTFKAQHAYPNLYVKLIVNALPLGGALPAGTTCYTPYATPQTQRPYCGLDVDYPRGHLSVLRHSPEDSSTPGATNFRATNLSGGTQGAAPTQYAHTHTSVGSRATMRRSLRAVSGTSSRETSSTYP